MKRIAAVLGLVLLATHALAGPIEAVPEPLRPWVPWVLHGVEDYGCPPQYNRAEAKRCAWPGRLELELGGAGGAFRQTVSAYRKAWFPLPGDAKRWPQQVTLDGQPATVVSKGDRPGIWLPAGAHALAGAFLWKALPEKLELPAEDALVALTLDGREVGSPFIDEAGLLWLARAAPSRAPSGPVTLRVYRLVEDGVPVRLATRLLIDAAASEERVYGPVLPPGAEPLALHSALPVRVEPDGSVRVQLRPGQWQIRLLARLAGPVTALAPPKAGGDWPHEEIWSFEPAPQVRLVTPGGAPAVDPRQAGVPQDWQQFPAFRLQPGERLTLAEVRRGDPQPVPDRLALSRRLWLDADGAGYTVQDRLTGSLSRSWRLEMQPPFALGRAVLDGTDRLITRLAPQSPPGVELRRGSISLVAESRVQGGLRTLPAAGWRHEFQSASAELELPPGWRLLSASGVDRAPGAWTAQWTLLDFFLVLIAALAARELWGWRWAGAILAMLVLTWHEPGAPTWVWLGLLAAAALVRWLPDGRLNLGARSLRSVLLLLLVVTGLPFAVGQIRQAIYPVLERPGVQVAPAYGYTPPPQAARLAPEAAVPRAGALSSLNRALESKMQAQVHSPAPSVLEEVDPKAAVQTGPGLPHWRWRSYALQWSGPVEPSQTMTLWLASPPVNALLDFARVALLVLAAFCVAGMKPPRLRVPPSAAALLVAAVALAWMSAAGAADVRVDDALLRELKARLTAPADCQPGCAEISRMAIDASGSSLTLRLAVSAQIDTAVPVPGRLGEWQPRQAMLDGHAAALARDERGVAWALVPKGVHQLVLEGPLAAVQPLALPLRPRLVEVHAPERRIEGIDASGVPDGALRIVALAAGGRELQQSRIPSFVRIERTFELGLRWQVLTRVVRVSADAAPVTIELPLLPGETVVSENAHAADGVVRAVLPAQAGEMQWRSTLAPRPGLALKSAAKSDQVEVWRFDTGTLWHVDFDGIPPVHHQSAGRWLPEWRPWPGETLSARVTRPEAVPGRTLTIDAADLEVAPGRRATDAKLALELRSSRGGEHEIVLPEGAELLGASIDGVSQPLRLEGRALRLPLAPGSQRAQIDWREPRGLTARFRAPDVDLQAPSVNASVHVHVPYDRWVLWVSGPRIGPAILFWGVVLALIPIAFGLARVPLAPLRAHDWFLLGLGLTQSSVEVSIVIVAWLFALGLREKRADSLGNQTHNLLQIGLGLLTLVALALLVEAVRSSLLGYPDMQIAGNGSGAWLLNWYQDRSNGPLPAVSVISVPLLAYRLAMLAWALWLAVNLLKWLKWGWRCFSAGGYWRRLARADSAPT